MQPVVELLKERTVWRTCFIAGTPRVAFVFLLARDTGALDTLNDVSLSEEVHDDKGYEDQDTCGIVDRSLVELLTREVNVE